MTTNTKKPAAAKTAKAEDGAKEVEKTNITKFIIFGVAIAAIIAAIIGVVIGLNSNPTINDAYFVTDNSKYVINIEGDEDDEAEATHIVYYYSGDTITGAKYFYEFKDEATAKAAYEALKSESADDEMSSYSLNGKYITITADKEDIEDMTVDDVKAQIEFYESLKKYDSIEEDEEE